MSEKRLLSVIIPAWNEEKYITPTLEALFAAGTRLEASGGAFEIVVVDNASTDATVERAEAFPVTILTEERRCIAVVRNRGAAAAKGDFLAFIDADSVASENSLLRIWKTLSSGLYCAGGVRILPERWTLRTIPFYALGPAMQMLLGVSAGMIFTTREAFEGVGGFDESFYAAEDLELLRAVKRWGRKSGKKFAHLTDVYIKTSVRKFKMARLSDWMAFPKYFLNRDSLRRAENCRFWYAEGHR